MNVGAQGRREIWNEIARECLRRTIRNVFRPARRRMWWGAAQEAVRYSKAENPPYNWPNGNPAWRETP